MGGARGGETVGDELSGLVREPQDKRPADAGDGVCRTATAAAASTAAPEG